MTEQMTMMTRSNNDQKGKKRATDGLMSRKVSLNGARIWVEVFRKEATSLARCTVVMVNGHLLSVLGSFWGQTESDEASKNQLRCKHAHRASDVRRRKVTEPHIKSPNYLTLLELGPALALLAIVTAAALPV